VNGVKNPRKLDKIVLPFLKEDEWIDVLIRTKENKLDVLINKKIF